MTNTSIDMCATESRGRRVGEPSPLLLPYTVAALLVLSAATLSALLVEEPAPSTALLVADVAAGLVGVALVPVLFRRPVKIALVLALMAAASPLATPSATLATVFVARTRPLRTALGVAAAGALAHTARGLWRPVPDLPLVWWAVLVVVAHAALLGWGAHAQARGQLLDSLRERAARAEADRDRLVHEARAEERTRIAREMHDVLAHRLSLLATYAGALEFRPDAPPEQLSRAAGVIRDGVHQALEEVREVVQVLRYEAPEGDVGALTQPSLRELADLVSDARAAGSPVELIEDVERPVAGTLARTAYRIVQEGLTNARKHAPGSPVLVRLSGGAPEGLTVEVTNPLLEPLASTGIPGSSTGLVGLAERVRIVGGRFEHDRSAHEFRLRAWLPWHP